MISDTLSDAAATIREYLRVCPDTYSEPSILSQVQAVLASMDALRVRLDAPPVLPGSRCSSCVRGEGS